MPVRGGEKWINKLKKMKNVSQVVDDWANDAAKEHVEVMRELIREGAIPPPNHVVSAPGNPPNEEYGDLAKDMRTEHIGVGRAVSIAYSDHALPLELGTSRMAERPFARPAAAILKKSLLIDARIRIDKHNKK